MNHLQIWQQCGMCHWFDILSSTDWHIIVNWYVKSLHTDHLLLSFTWFLTNQNHTSASLKMISKDLHRIWNHWLHSTCEDRLKLDKKFDLNRVQSPTLRSAATLCQSSELDAPLQLQAVLIFLWFSFKLSSLLQPAWRLVSTRVTVRVSRTGCDLLSSFVKFNLKSGVNF